MAVDTITKRIAIESITILRAEGPAEMCIRTIHTTWADAEARIRAICHTAPKEGGYDKCDFKIRYMDGNLYEGRYDAAHPDSKAYEGTLEGHVRGHCEFVAGLAHPKHLTPERYDAYLQTVDKAMRDEALAFLTKYALSDEKPEPSPSQAAFQQAERIRTENGEPSTATPSPAPAQGVTQATAKPEEATIAKAPTMDGTTPGAPTMATTTAPTANPLPVICKNSWPLRNVFRAMGGTWNKGEQRWYVPAEKHAEAQRIATENDAKYPVKAKPAATPDNRIPLGTVTVKDGTVATDINAKAVAYVLSADQVKAAAKAQEDADLMATMTAKQAAEDRARRILTQAQTTINGRVFHGLYKGGMSAADALKAYAAVHPDEAKAAEAALDAADKAEADRKAAQARQAAPRAAPATRRPRKGAAPQKPQDPLTRRLDALLTAAEAILRDLPQDHPHYTALYAAVQIMQGRQA